MYYIHYKYRNFCIVFTGFTDRKASDSRAELVFILSVSRCLISQTSKKEKTVCFLKEIRSAEYSIIFFWNLNFCLSNRSSQNLQFLSLKPAFLRIFQDLNADLNLKNTLKDFLP